MAFCGLVTSCISLIKILSKGKSEEKEPLIRNFSVSTQELSEEESRGKFRRRLMSASSLILTEKKN